MSIAAFPDDWSSALVLVAHPDDPEYGVAAAVAKWTAEGRTVVYALATSGEAGIEGMDPAEAGPLREDEQRASAAVVGVDAVEFWGFEDSAIGNTPELRAKIVDTLRRVRPDLVVSMYGGPEWAPGFPNQRDHREFAAAVVDAYDEVQADEQAPDRPRALFVNGPGSTHAVDVEGFTEIAVRSLAEHDVYLSVLDPDTPVLEQARAQVARTTGPIEGFPAAQTTGLTRLRP
ncbi:MAG: PIG-L family deacetylase [Gordonia sp. (in: high G+C Gram-positive bacteria)]|uniref:PIG-L deacetylase family protein n=1 Tax=Gordonia sp. (in: high G+C Gram-positive bacteria) TaxID=84139 RepID=UPI0039E66A8D